MYEKKYMMASFINTALIRITADYHQESWSLLFYFDRIEMIFFCGSHLVVVFFPRLNSYLKQFFFCLDPNVDLYSVPWIFIFDYIIYLHLSRLIFTLYLDTTPIILI